jgi:hypothetical protein
VPPPRELRPSAQWGTPERVKELLGGDTELRFVDGSLAQRFPTVEFYLDFFVEHYGPVLKAVDSLDDESRASFRRDLGELASRFNRGTSGELVYHSDSLIVTGTKLR